MVKTVVAEKPEAVVAKHRLRHPYLLKLRYPCSVEVPVPVEAPVMAPVINEKNNFFLKFNRRNGIKRRYKIF
ncbi:MAG: hypothetical protein IPL63_14930 [Saprospiraceae bacterium]|nr:hypothetical protein [Saprospiraceae bacterium]